MIRINLVPENVLAKEAGKARIVQFAILGGLVLVLVAGVSVHHWWKKHKVIMALEETKLQLKKLEEIVKQVEELERTQGIVKARLAEVVTLSKGRPLYPYFMEDVARTLPQGVWLTQLGTTPAGGGALLKVLATASSRSHEDIADWIRSLEGSGRFDTVELGAVSGAASAAGGVFNFTLTANYKNPNL